MTQDALYVSTRKGLMIYERSGSDWKLANLAHRGSPVSITLPSKDGKTVFAALNLGHFGVKLHRSDDGGATWTELQPPRYPKEPPKPQMPSLDAPEPAAPEPARREPVRPEPLAVVVPRRDRIGTDSAVSSAARRSL